MAETFKIVKGETVVVEGLSPLTITGLQPDTTVAEGDYKAIRVVNGMESDPVDIPSFKTLPIKVTGVTVSPKTLSLEVGKNGKLSHTLEPSNATVKTVTYTSDKPAVATVTSNGEVTAVSAGTAIITVKSTDGSKTDTATITVTEPEVEPEPEE